MNFSEVLIAVKNGSHAFRSNWNGKNMFIFLVPGKALTVDSYSLLQNYPKGTLLYQQPYISLSTATGNMVPWTPSQTDMFAEDWVLLNETQNN